MDSKNEELKKKAIESTDRLYNIFMGNPIDYDLLCDLLISSSNYELQIIADEYKKKYNKSVLDEINTLVKDEDTRYIMSLMFYNYYELDARILHKALKEGKRDEKAIIEIFASRPHWFLQVVDEEYKRIYGISLKDDLAKEKKSDFITFLLCIINTPRSKVNTIKNVNQASDAAHEIILKGLKQYGTDVDLFKNLFVKRSREDLIMISREYKTLDKKKRNLYDAVDDAVPKTTRELLKAIIFAVSIPAHFFAMQLRKSIEGLGTDEETLSRVLVTRHEVDMGFIRAYYKLDGKYELVEDIIGDTSGSYQKICLKLANA